MQTTWRHAQRGPATKTSFLPRRKITLAGNVASGNAPFPTRKLQTFSRIKCPKFYTNPTLEMFLMASDHAFCAARTSAWDTLQGSPLSPAATGLIILIKVPNNRNGNFTHVRR